MADKRAHNRKPAKWCPGAAFTWTDNAEAAQRAFDELHASHPKIDLEPVGFANILLNVRLAYLGLRQIQLRPSGPHARKANRKVTSFLKALSRLDLKRKDRVARFTGCLAKLDSHAEWILTGSNTEKCDVLYRCRLAFSSDVVGFRHPLTDMPLSADDGKTPSEILAACNALLRNPDESRQVGARAYSEDSFAIQSLMKFYTEATDQAPTVIWRSKRAKSGRTKNPQTDGPFIRFATAAMEYIAGRTLTGRSLAAIIGKRRLV